MGRAFLAVNAGDAIKAGVNPSVISFAGWIHRHAPAPILGQNNRLGPDPNLPARMRRR